MVSLKGLRILVVEDEPFVALDLEMSIQDAGAIPVGPASTIAEALALLGKETPDGAILDVNLPDGTIGAVLDALPPGVAVVVQTGVGLPPEERARHPDVQVFLKPTDPAVLLRRVAALLEQKTPRD